MSCEHLRDYLGDEFEDARLGLKRTNRKAAKVPRGPGIVNEEDFKDVKGSGFNISVMLANTFSETIDPTGWYMSEKLDGVRCYWNGSNMYTRNGHRFYPPKWFTESLPKIPLDGELFLERGKFEATVSIVRKQYEHDGWADIVYVVFDAPSIKKPFKTRFKDL